MKKNVLMFVSLFLAIAFLPACARKEAAKQSSAKDDPGAQSDDQPLLSSAEEIRLKKDFAAYMAEQWPGITYEEVSILYYYGTYHGYEAVVLYGKDFERTNDLKEITAGGYTITLPSGSLELLIHMDSTFITLQDAYEQGYITADDIHSIQQEANPQ